MRRLTTALALLCCLSFTGAANAALITKNFSWVGDGGYSASGVLSYDDAFPSVSGFGLGPTTGIDFLEITMFDPSNQPFQSVVDVSGGISTYFFLEVQFDTASMAFFGDFDMGKDDFMIGDTWIIGSIGGPSEMRQRDAISIQVLDSISTGTSISVSSVPEPSTIALLAIGLLGMGYACRRHPR